MSAFSSPAQLAFDALPEEESSPFDLADCKLIGDALERARVVGIIDAFADARRKASPSRCFDVVTSCDTSGRYSVSWPGRLVWGDTLDQARSRAAEDIEAGRV